MSSAARSLGTSGASGFARAKYYGAQRRIER